MALQNTPQSIPANGRHFGPGTLRRAADVVGPSIQVPPIQPGAQTNRASQITRNAAESTNARSVDRSGFYGGSPNVSPA
jgi:hypothetical protein